MNIHITEQDRQNTFRVALKNIAEFYNVYKPETNQEIYDRLKTMDVTGFIQLKEYLQAYNNYFNFYKNINEKSKEYELTSEERTQLNALIKNRFDASDAFQKYMDDLKFEKFKKIHGIEGGSELVF
jgi:hypothetical protein